MSKLKLIIHAPNIHFGGGSVLLRSLLKVVPEGTRLIADRRMELDEGSEQKLDRVWRVKPSVISRFMAEFKLKSRVGKEDVLVCFGNLPPLFQVKGETKIFLQNRYLIDNVSLSEFPFKVRLRLALERLWLRATIAHVDQVIVQTPTMKMLFESKFSKKAQVLSYAPDAASPSKDAMDELPEDARDFDFIYVASGDPHKNHKKLLQAWVILAQQGIRPKLCLTIDTARYSELCQWIEELSEKHALNVQNAGHLDAASIHRHYQRSRAVIYPSLFESFGLPLIEGARAGLPIIASEADYVRDVAVPEECFDPHSPLSIARAVTRFSGGQSDTVQVLSAASFLERMIAGANV